MRLIKLHLTTGLLAVAVLGLAGCSTPAPTPAPVSGQAWFDAVLDDEYKDDDSVSAGGGAVGTTITITDVKAGWYALDRACQGTTEATFTVSHSEETLGEGQGGCDGSGFFTSTMELPAGGISVTATSEDPSTWWAARLRPTAAPTP